MSNRYKRNICVYMIRDSEESLRLGRVGCVLWHRGEPSTERSRRPRDPVGGICNQPAIRVIGGRGRGGMKLYPSLPHHVGLDVGFGISGGLDRVGRIDLDWYQTANAAVSVGRGQSVLLSVAGGAPTNDVPGVTIQVDLGRVLRHWQRW